MIWQNFEDLDPTYSGYAWVQFWKTYGEPTEPEWIHLCRIWNTEGKVSKWWTGWDLDFDDRMSSNYDRKVMLVERPYYAVDKGSPEGDYTVRTEVKDGVVVAIDKLHPSWNDPDRGWI